MKGYLLGLAAGLLAVSSATAADIDEGEKVFRKCQACHMAGEDAKARVGPVLNNLFGRQAGTNEEYGSKYSKAMVEAGENGLVWNEETLFNYLENPRAMVEGTKMAFPGLKQEEDRRNVIAYLKQFSPE